MTCADSPNCAVFPDAKPAVYHRNNEDEPNPGNRLVEVGGGT